MTIAYRSVRCPACNREGDEELAGADELTRETEDLWEFHLRRLLPGTPRQFLADRVIFSQRPPLRLGRCTDCGTLYRNPLPLARDVEAGYAGESLDPEVARSLQETQRAAYRAQARRLTRIAGGRGNGLEIGSYVGGFLAAARDEGWAFEGVDLSEATNRLARGLGFRVTTGTLDDLAGDLSFRAVAVWNCFDQLTSPRETLAAIRAVLSPGGVVAIRVPNGAFYAALHARLGGRLAWIARTLLAHNNLLGFPFLHGFTPGSLTALLRDRGFQPISLVGDTLVPIADHWTRRWAAAEERAIKRLLRSLLPANRSPWFEIYARRDETAPITADNLPPSAELPTLTA